MKRRATRRMRPRKPTPAGKTRRTGKRHAGQRRSLRDVGGAINRLRKAQETLGRSASDLLRVAEKLGESAVGRYRESLVHELLERQYPRDLVLAREVVLRMPENEAAADLKAVRGFADSMLRWLEERFGLTASLQPGQELEVPVSRLDGYEIEGERPPDVGQLVRVRVLLPGWRVNGRGVVRPQVRLLP